MECGRGIYHASGERFFTYVHEGKDNLEALRQAHADVREVGYEPPFFWAPFVLIGT